MICFLPYMEFWNFKNLWLNILIVLKKVNISHGFLLSDFFSYFFSLRALSICTLDFLTPPFPLLLFFHSFIPPYQIMNILFISIRSLILYSAMFNLILNQSSEYFVYVFFHARNTFITNVLYLISQFLVLFQNLCFLKIFFSKI